MRRTSSARCSKRSPDALTSHLCYKRWQAENCRFCFVSVADDSSKARDHLMRLMHAESALERRRCVRRTSADARTLFLIDGTLSLWLLCILLCTDRVLLRSIAGPVAQSQCADTAQHGPRFAGSSACNFSLFKYYINGINAVHHSPRCIVVVAADVFQHRDQQPPASHKSNICPVSVRSNPTTT